MDLLLLSLTELRVSARARAVKSREKKPPVAAACFRWSRVELLRCARCRCLEIEFSWVLVAFRSRRRRDDQRSCIRIFTFFQREAREFDFFFFTVFVVGSIIVGFVYASPSVDPSRLGNSAGTARSCQELCYRRVSHVCATCCWGFRWKLKCDLSCDSILISMIDSDIL